MADGERVQDFIAVTDPLLDAPDGSVVKFPNGHTYERIGDEWCRLDAGCTGLSASWCPIHGDCSCPRRDDGEVEFSEGETTCPLHALTSSHAAHSGRKGLTDG